ncbi:hypothetical protein F2Q68_00002271 [Brassica cretica]|uniref:Uncharacterized protein n=1 Tax=Brassica cretica TaxID=69181 RepID=A0A8S9J7U2_BRACR|nr:hypothetical protein F2Q68_00002271 [Brassica cretica]
MALWRASSAAELWQEEEVVVLGLPKPKPLNWRLEKLDLEEDFPNQERDRNQN